MKLQDVPFVKELSSKDEVEVYGGFSFSVQSENTNLSTADCVDEASLAFVQSGLQPSISNNLVYDVIGDNIIVARCDGGEEIAVFAAGVAPFSTHRDRARSVLNNYP